MHPRLDYLWLEITAKCNLNCIHCYADSGPDKPLTESLSTDDWLLALEEAAGLGCRKVQFIGGEPTLHPDLPQLISKARSLGFESVEVYTNGTGFTSLLKETFLHHRVGLAFSVYSDESVAHEAVTLRHGSFNKTMESIRWAVNKKLAVRAGVIEMDINQDHVDLAKNHLHEMGVKNVRRDRLRGVGRGSSDHANHSLSELCGACVKGRLCLTADGTIYPCVFSRWRSVGDFRDGLAVALSGSMMSQFRNDMTEFQHSRSNFSKALSDCAPEEDPGPCNPDKDPGPCNPDKDPGPCNPDKDPGPCNPDKDPGPCNPEQSS